MNYYNEFDPFAAAWLRQLIKAGLIADGVVDERSILDVAPKDLEGFTQCHFFAGIGVWSYALRQSGWPDDRPVWTGSAPCQPFSNAGTGAGFADERHLWPAFHHLIKECSPPVVFGEQVASKLGREWLDTVQTDLEALGFAFGSADLCAAGVGAPNIRQRLYFIGNRMVHTKSERFQEREHFTRIRGRKVETQQRQVSERSSNASGMAYTPSERLDRCENTAEQAGRDGPQNSGASGGLADASQNRFGEARGSESETGDDGTERNNTIGGMANSEHHGHDQPKTDEAQQKSNQEKHRLLTRGHCGLCGTDAGPTNGFWANPDWLFCRDGKWRPVEPESFPLAHGVTNRVGKLRGYGNAINAETAKAFIKSTMEAMKL